MPLPDEAAARELLAWLAVPDVEAVDILGSRPGPGAAADLDRLYRELIAGMDSTLPPPRWEQRTDHVYSWLFLSAVAAARANHARRGVDADVSQATLRDYTRHVVLYRQTYGHSGLDAPQWLALSFRGTLFQLGRLQFQRAHKDDTPVLDVHIPAFEPLLPDAVDASFDAARRFFPRHFPEEHYESATCTSWLLDEQLAEYLPETSNILAFQRRFELVAEDGADADAFVLEFVFRRPRERPDLLADLALLPQHTTLQRGIVAHLRAGRHWQWRTGVRRL